MAGYTGKGFFLIKLSEMRRHTFSLDLSRKEEPHLIWPHLLVAAYIKDTGEGKVVALGLPVLALASLAVELIS